MADHFKIKRSGTKRVRISCQACWIVTRDGPKHPSANLPPGEKVDAWMADHRHRMALAEARVAYYALLHPAEVAMPAALADGSVVPQV